MAEIGSETVVSRLTVEPKDTLLTDHINTRDLLSQTLFSRSMSYLVRRRLLKQNREQMLDMLKHISTSRLRNVWRIDRTVFNSDAGSSFVDSAANSHTTILQKLGPAGASQSSQNIRRYSVTEINAAIGMCVG